MRTQTTQFELETADGAMRIAVARPDGIGAWPGVVMLMDGLGFRAALVQMAERLAAFGYVVALPDLFHRCPPTSPAELRALLFDPARRAEWRATYYASAASPTHLAADVGAVLHHFSQRSDVAAGPRGVTGYCMGGNLALRCAGAFADDFGAAASFHGSNLASDAPESPHLQAPRIKAELYVAGAVEDASFPDEMKARLEQAFADAGVTHVVETYAGAKHGFAVPDTPVFDVQASDRHFASLEALFARRLKRRN